MSSTFSSLSIPNYRKYFIGLLVANLGSWMATTAKSWLVLEELTHHDAAALGVMTAMVFAPSLVFAPVAGFVADRYPKRTIMFCCQLFQLVSGAVLAALVVTGRVELWHVYLLAFLDGTAGAICAPAQQAFVSEVVPHENLTNAIALNSAQFQAARLLGPGVAGILIATVGTSNVFIINVFTFAFYIVMQRIMDPGLLQPAPLQRGKGQLLEGLRYVRRRPDIMLLIFCAFMMGNFGFNFGISNPLMATEAYGKGAAEFGALGSIMGIGALAAALMSARAARPRLRYVLIALAVFTVSSAFAALSPSYWFFALMQVPIGLGSVMVLVVGNSLVQIGTAPQFRGRVMTVWSTMLLGGTPFISPLVGWLGKEYGARATVWFETVSILLTIVAVGLWIRKSENLRVQIDRTHRIPWISVARGGAAEEVTLASAESK